MEKFKYTKLAGIVRKKEDEVKRLILKSRDPGAKPKAKIQDRK